MLTRFGQNKVLIYHSPPQELDLSGAGITSIGSIAGNVFFAQSLPSKVSGKIRDLISGGPINGAIITTSGGGATRSTRGQYSLSEIAGKWTMRAKADGYKPYITSLSIDPAKQYIRKDINMSPRSKPCGEDVDCDDGQYCNGMDVCVDGTCQPGKDPCEDDGLYCNGEESCNEDDDICDHSGSPCPGHLACNEESDECVEKVCDTDKECDDGPILQRCGSLYKWSL